MMQTTVVKDLAVIKEERVIRIFDQEKEIAMIRDRRIKEAVSE